MAEHHGERLDLLILARLATAGTRPPSAGKLDKDLYRFVEARLSRHEWSARCARRLEALLRAGDIDDRRSPTKRGRERLMKALGVRALPPRWSKMWRALLPALALELPGARWSEVGNAEALRARIIRQHHDLPIVDTPTLRQAVDAQAWKALGIDETGPLTLGKIRRALLERTLETQIRAKSIDTAEAGQWLATGAVGTPTRDVATIQAALVSRWVFDDGAEAPREAKPRPAEPRPAEIAVVTPRRPKAAPAKQLPLPAAKEQRRRSNKRKKGKQALPLKRWAELVQGLAQRTTNGRYGEERVFVAAVWRAAQRGPNELRGSLPDFKARLIAANREGLLRLHRADLVGAMDERMVRESEIEHLNASFHFIEISPRRRS